MKLIRKAFLEGEGREPTRVEMEKQFRYETGEGLPKNFWKIGGLLFLAFWLAGCSPCHQGHSEERFYPAHVQVQTIGKSTIFRSVPERCSWVRVCDETCESRDRGRREAHAEHAELNGRVWRDPRCVRE